MARLSNDREDLLREATALVPRVELRCGQAEVVAGFRGEALSLYFDGDPVYHFNSGGELRRAFVDGKLFKAEQGRLAALTYSRGGGETEMQRHDLSSQETAEFGLALNEKLRSLRGALERGECAVVGQVPAEGDALPRLVEWLGQFGELRIASSPRVST